MSRRTALGEVQLLAEEQYGLVTAAQVRTRGVPRWDLDRLVSDGVLEPQQSHGVYRLVGSGGPLWLPVLGAWLSLRPEVPGWQRVRHPDAVVSHASAAEVHGVGDLIPTQHEFLVQRRRQTRRPDLWLHVLRELDRDDWEVIDGVLPTTTVRRTIDDLLARQVDGSAVAGLGQSALEMRGITEADVVEMAERHAARYGYQPDDLAALLRGELLGSIG